MAPRDLANLFTPSPQHPDQTTADITSAPMIHTPQAQTRKDEENISTPDYFRETTPQNLNKRTKAADENAFSREKATSNVLANKETTADSHKQFAVANPGLAMALENLDQLYETAASSPAPIDQPESNEFLYQALDKPRFYDGLVITHYGDSKDCNSDFLSKSQENTGPFIACTVQKVFIESWFFKFPLEIRQRIYRYRLFPKGVSRAPRPSFSHFNKWRLRVPALLHASSAIRREALPLYYAELRPGTGWPKDVIDWLKVIGKEAREALSSMRVRFDDTDERQTKAAEQKQMAWLVFRTNGVDLKKRKIVITNVPSWAE